MAIHLICLAVNKLYMDLQGSVQIFSDCNGALLKVQHLPPYEIPSRCSHSDILKNIMVNRSNLSFERIFSHVKAHQDNHLAYETLPRPSQLNCQMDYYAKKAIWEYDREELRDTPQFPLEPVCVGREQINQR